MVLLKSLLVINPMTDFLMTVSKLELRIADTFVMHQRVIHSATELNKQYRLLYLLKAISYNGYDIGKEVRCADTMERENF